MLKWVKSKECVDEFTATQDGVKFYLYLECGDDWAWDAFGKTWRARNKESGSYKDMKKDVEKFAKLIKKEKSK